MRREKDNSLLVFNSLQTGLQGHYDCYLGSYCKVDSSVTHALGHYRSYILSVAVLPCCVPCDTIV